MKTIRLSGTEWIRMAQRQLDMGREGMTYQATAHEILNAVQFCVACDWDIVPGDLTPDEWRDVQNGLSVRPERSLAWRLGGEGTDPYAKAEEESCE